MESETGYDSGGNPPAGRRLGSWKEIASYLNCGVRTVQRWERLEGLPVHRHVHGKLGSVYAFEHELDAWREARKANHPEAASAIEPEPQPGSPEDLAPAEAPGVAPLLKDDPVAASSPVREPDAAARARPIRMALRAALAAAPIVLLAGALLVYRLTRPTPKAEAGRAMLAVLPFTNLSGDPSQDYFSDGLTEEMITQLGRTNPARLGVIARTSAMQYKDGKKSVAEIGRELGVGYVLEGSVRREPHEVRISAQLIQVSDQTHLWAQSYEVQGRDPLEAQQGVARAIAERIQAKLNLSAAGAASSASGQASERAINAEAYEDYLKGRYFWNLRTTEGLKRAADYFTRSTTKDPSYAPAYAGLADCYTLLALYGSPPREVLPLAKEAALKSVELDDSLAEAHTSVAAVDAIYDWNWPEAERQFKRALELNPNYAPAHHWYAQLYLIPQGRYDEAITEMQLALTLDPVSLIINTDLGWTYFVARRDDQAFAQYKKTLEMSPQFLPVHFRLGQYYSRRHMYDAAVAETEEDNRIEGNAAAADELARVFASGGYRGVLDRALKSAETAPSSNVHAASEAELYIELGDTKQAFEFLERAFADRAPDLIYLRADPTYDEIRKDPRFGDLERRVGLDGGVASEMDKK